jgi:hypothetical protein
MTPDLLRRVGQALYGQDWKTALARALDVNERSVRRWDDGASPIPGGVRGELLQLVGKRGGELIELQRDLTRAA